MAESYADKVDLGGCLNENELLLVRWQKTEEAEMDMEVVQKVWTEQMEEIYSETIMTKEEVIQEFRIE